ncbi:MAG: Zn-dependent alcohol dehydrogenase [Proteobacteria bacterium]|nr:Zn-dependent alcohol dehydrogenase [Pseudomonadota bacterium]
MQIRSKAVVYRAGAATVAVEDIVVDPPGADEVQIQVSACGVCHSDLSVTNGTLPLPPPIVLGHEAAGVITRVGPGVSDLQLGDHVIVNFIASCGHCRYCATGRPNLCDHGGMSALTPAGGAVRTWDADGQPLNVMTGCGVMAEHATLHKNNVVKIDAQAPLDRCALIGCGVMTGWGAACNTAKVQPGSVCVVFGAGGVGLSAIQGCQNAGAAMIVAVDRLAHKLDMARLFGATHVVDASKTEQLVKDLRKLTGGGADYAFECVGFGEIVAQAYGCLRRGGTAVVVGVGKPTDMSSVKTASLVLEEKALMGSCYGSARPRYDFPRLVSLYRAGRLKLDELITHRYRIDDAVQAFDDLVQGRNARGLIVFD